MDEALHERPAELLARLIRFDTTNPPGDEAECVAFVESLLREAGIETRIVAKDERRPNLVARLPGGGSAAPLLLQGHVDVVTTAGQEWSVPPFEGRMDHDFVWGRGTLDMKGGVAMMVAALLRAKAAGLEPAGDVILCVMADEEAGGDHGARFLVEEHPELFEGVRFALGEFGGFNFEVGGRRLYPIMVAEKQACWMRALVRGPGGHGAMPMRGGAMARVGRILAALDRNRLPVHITPVVRAMIAEIAAAAPLPARPLFEALRRPRATDRILRLLGERGEAFDPLVHNTVNATTIHGGDKVNVIPSEIEIGLDGRLLPGFSPDDLIRELRAVAGEEMEIEVARADPVAPVPDMTLFPMLAGILREADPQARPIPNLLAAITDGRYFARLGIQTYGFTPMQLPRDMAFAKLIHGADERIPAASLEFGTAAILEALRRFR